MFLNRQKSKAAGLFTNVKALTCGLNMRNAFQMTNCVLFLHSEDKGALAKLVEAIKTNYNDRYDEVRFHLVLLLNKCIDMNLVGLKCGKRYVLD